jgi:hypothetical protein
MVKAFDFFLVHLSEFPQLIMVVMYKFEEIYMRTVDFKKAHNCLNFLYSIVNWVKLKQITMMANEKRGFQSKDNLFLRSYLLYKLIYFRSVL